MKTIAVIGLGYVGLPLVVEFGKTVRTIGFDIAVDKVQACQRGTDPSRERPDFSRLQPTERRDLGRSGTFLVVRQLEQDKEAFDNFLRETADQLRGDPRAPPDEKERRE